MSSEALSNENPVSDEQEKPPPAVRAVENGLDRLPLAGPLDALGRASALDPAISSLQNAVRKLPLGGLRDVLHGRWLGHPLHPALVQLPIGAWMSAGVLDLLPGTRRASRVLIGTGMVAALPAAWTGAADWAELHKPQLRTGLVHALANSAALGLYAASLTARMRGRECRGRLLGFGGLTAAGLGGLIGGHLAYRQAAGPNKAEPVQHLVEPGWHPVGKVTGFRSARRRALRWARSSCWSTASPPAGYGCWPIGAATSRGRCRRGRWLKAVSPVRGTAAPSGCRTAGTSAVRPRRRSPASRRGCGTTECWRCACRRPTDGAAYPGDGAS